MNIDVIECNILEILFNKISQYGKNWRGFCYTVYKIQFIYPQQNKSPIIIIIIIGQAKKQKKNSVYL
jgi:hypothetical protein